MATYSDDEKHSNFLRVKEHIYLLNTMRLTEDLMEEYTNYLCLLRDNFSDFTTVNPEIRDYEFRSAAVQAETMISHIFHDMKTHGTFNTGDYLQLLYAILKMSEFIINDDELVDLMGTIQFQ